MTYSLRTLNSANGTPESDLKNQTSEGVGLLRFTQEIVLLIGAVSWLALALATVSAARCSFERKWP